MNDAIIITIQAVSAWYSEPGFAETCNNCTTVDEKHLNCSGILTDFDDCIECNRDKALGWLILEFLTASLALLFYVGLKHTAYSVWFLKLNFWVGNCCWGQNGGQKMVVFVEKSN